MRTVRPLLVIFVALFGVALRAQDAPGKALAQPIPFDHKLHAQTAKMVCNDCHEPRGSGSTVAMPQPPKCMTCHASVAADKPDIQRLATAAKNEDPIPWVRVFRVPSFVTFSHKTHSASGCEECHGPVAERTAIALEHPTTMGSCIACHATKQAPTTCDTCHAIMAKVVPFSAGPEIRARLDAPAVRPWPVVSALAGFLHAPAL